MENKAINNPWKGLNFYIEGEILYGRNAEIQSLSQYIFNNTQTVLYGRSGIGKSSILNAGIFPKARLEGMVPISIRLKHESTSNYLEQIRVAIADGGLRAEAVLDSVNGEENETLWEYMHRHLFYDKNGVQSIPLLVLDQFEEIFTLQKKETIKRDFFKQLGDLFNEVKPDYIVEYENEKREKQASERETKVISSGAFKGLSLTLNIKGNDEADGDVSYIEQPNYHIVFALREDFLSSLELYTTCIPVMKNNRFGLLPINEEQAADIIRLPRKGLIASPQNDYDTEKDVTWQIIHQVTGRSDFILDGKPEIEVDAAMLSLYLSRLYAKKPESESQITLELVKASSGDIIQDFYLECITSNEDEIISTECVEILERELLTGEGRRNNVSRSDLIAKGISDKELDILVEKRKLLRQFYHGDDIRVEYIHDTLCKVVEERREQRELLKQQEIERQRLQEEAERKQHEIEEQAAKEKAALEEKARKTRKRNKLIYIISAVFITIIAASITFYYFTYLYTYESYYKDFTRVYGWPTGVGAEMNKNERAETPIYYRLSHVGTKSPLYKWLNIGSNSDYFTDVEVCSSNKIVPHRPRIISSLEKAEVGTRDAKALAFNELLSNIRRIHFVEGENGLVEKEVALNDNDSTLFIVSYFHTNNKEMWGTFLSPTGQPMQIREKEGIDRMKVVIGADGRIQSQMYYDQNEACQPIKKDICGYAWKYGETTDSCYLLNEINLPVSVSLTQPYNMVITDRNGKEVVTRYRRVTSIDEDNDVAVSGPEGFTKLIARNDTIRMYVSESDEWYSTKILEKDKNGNVLVERIENNLSSKVPAITRYSYSGDGELVKEERLTRENVSFVEADSADYLYEWGFRNGKKIREIRRNKYGITYQHIIENKGNITREIKEDVLTNEYWVKVDTTFRDGYSTSYYGRDGRAINYGEIIDELQFKYHRKWCVKDDEIERNYFYVRDSVTGAIVKAPLVVENDYLNSYYRKDVKKDEYGNVVSYKKYDENERIVKSMMYFTQNGQIIGRAAQGIDGTPIRCDKWEEEGFLYYKIYYTRDRYGNYVSILGLNEWGQKSVFFDPISNEYGKVKYVDLKDKQVTIKDGQISDFVAVDVSAMINVPCKVHALTGATEISNFGYSYLHVLDKASSLYKAGFRDGDRIIKFGNWSVGGSEESLANEWSAWDGWNKSTRIEVIRPTKVGSVERIRKEVKSPLSSKGLHHYHVLKITEEEYQYLKDKEILK